MHALLRIHAQSLEAGLPGSNSRLDKLKEKRHKNIDVQGHLSPEKKLNKKLDNKIGAVRSSSLIRVRCRIRTSQAHTTQDSIFDAAIS